MILAIAAFLIAVIGAVVFWPLPDPQPVSVEPSFDGASWVSSMHLETPQPLNRPDVQSEILQAVLELKNAHPIDHRSVHLVGLVYSELKQSTEAERHLRGSLELNPNETQVRYDLAELLMTTGRHDEALQVLEPNKIPASDRLDYLCLIADAQSQVGQLSDATETLAVGVRKFPNSARVWRTFGTLQLQQEDYSKAESSLRKAIELDKHNEQAYFALCQSLALRNKTDEASEVRRALELLQAEKKASNQSFEVVHEASFRRFAASIFRSMAYLRDQFNEVIAAKTCFVRSLEIEPDNIPTRLMFASFLRKQGELTGATDLMRSIVQLQPDVFANYTNLASLCMESGKPELAEATLRVASERDVGDGQAHLHLAKFLMLADNAKEAVVPARLAFNRMKSADAMLTLVAALEQSGNATEANEIRLRSHASTAKPKP